MDPYFYTITTGGAHTNLQLEFLGAARRELRLLERELTRLQPGQVTGKCAVICSNLAQSISQLLGQNMTQRSERVDYPKSMLGQMLNDEDRPDLLPPLTELLDKAEDIRHFAATPKRTKHESVGALTLADTKRFYEATIELWNVAVERHKQLPTHNLGDFTGIEHALDNYEAYADDGTLSHFPECAPKKSEP